MIQIIDVKHQKVTQDSVADGEHNKATAKKQKLDISDTKFNGPQLEDAIILNQVVVSSVDLAENDARIEHAQIDLI